MSSYNGHKNWNHWNVSLWINNDEGLYRMALECVKEMATKEEAAKYMLRQLEEFGHTQTPDGAPYSQSSIRAAMVEM